MDSAACENAFRLAIESFGFDKLIEKIGALSVLAGMILLDMTVTIETAMKVIEKVPEIGHPMLSVDGCNRLCLCGDTCLKHLCLHCKGAEGPAVRLHFDRSVSLLIKTGRNSPTPNTTRWMALVVRDPANCRILKAHKTALMLINWLLDQPAPYFRDDFRPETAISWVLLYGFERVKTTLTSLGIKSVSDIPVDPSHSFHCVICNRRLTCCRCPGRLDILRASITKGKLFSLENYTNSELMWEAMEMGSRVSDSGVKEWVSDYNKISNDEMNLMLSCETGTRYIIMNPDYDQTVELTPKGSILRDHGIEIVRRLFKSISIHKYRRRYGRYGKRPKNASYTKRKPRERWL
jgi:hypothetical protein